MRAAFGFEALSCASTGNSRTRPPRTQRRRDAVYVFVPDDLERAKILATETYGAKVVAVKGNYDDVNRLCAEVADPPVGRLNVNMRRTTRRLQEPRLRGRGELGWRVCPTTSRAIASGAL